MGSVSQPGTEPFPLSPMSRVSGKPDILYILWSQQGRRFYVGVSENPQRRLHQHNEGKSGWTARHRPWILVHEERYENYRTARLREIELKRQKGGQRFYQLTGLQPGRLHPRA